MVSASGRYIISFNGEIYNFRELRTELKTNGSAIAFRGQSDTEVMLAAFDRWGLRGAIRKFNGMFAFAVWDREMGILTLARDRCGEKPLYYGWMGGFFLFGSELKALRAHRCFSGRISRNSIALFVRHGYVPAPYSIYEDIWKLPPASILQIPGNANAGYLGPTSYWSVKDVVESGARDPLYLTDHEAVARLDSLLTDAVQLRMVADVPVGAFLSGGVDSAMVVALMQKCSARPVKTFTIGFREAGYDEAAHAAKVAKHLGCDHTELYVTPAEAMGVVPMLPVLYDEPFADSSQIPTYLVSRLARRQVTVSLSGDGGDEVFGGYTRYQWADAVWRKVAWLPVKSRKHIAGLLASVPHRTWEAIFRAISPLLPAPARQTNSADKVQKLAEILPADSREALYYRLVSQWNHPTDLVLGASALPTTLTERDGWAVVPDFVQRMMFLDTITYLPDDILVKLDRASMAVGLESRVPFLDHRVIELSWRLPLTMKLRDGQTKWLLRQALCRYVPPGLVDRPKSGFAVPVHEWLRGPLRDWAEQLLDADRLRREGFYDPAPIRQKWADHLSGRHNRMPELWNILMFQAWLEHERASRLGALDASSTCVS